MQKSKYLVANERDARWGLTVSTVGYDEVHADEPYPTPNHPDGYYFDTAKGRILNEYQLLYLVEGEGLFTSDHQPSTKIKSGDFFLLFPGEWHNYHPLPGKKWKSFWIGYRGRNMDDRVRAGFMSPEKPIYHVGYSAEIVNLYRSALKASLEEAAFVQQTLAGIVNHLIGLMYSLERNIIFNKDSERVEMINRARQAHPRSLGESAQHPADSQRDERQLQQFPQTLQGIYGHFTRSLSAGPEAAAPRNCFPPPI